MTRYIATIVLAVALVVGFTAPASAQMSLATAPTTLVTNGVIPSTGAADTITTFAMPSNVKAVHFYCDWHTTGGISAATFRPAALMTNSAVASTATSGYFVDYGSANVISLSKAAKSHLRVPRDQFGAFGYGGLAVGGTGTLGLAYYTAYYKFEY